MLLTFLEIQLLFSILILPSIALKRWNFPDNLDIKSQKELKDESAHRPKLKAEKCGWLTHSSPMFRFHTLCELYRHRSGVLIVNFELISDIFLVFPFLTLKWMSAGCAKEHLTLYHHYIKLRISFQLTFELY